MSSLSRLLRPRARRVDVLVAALLALLGFALAVQVRSTQSDGLLTSARQEDLVQILDELNNRSDRLRQEVASLSATKQRLTTGSGASTAALAEARRRTQLLGVLAGTVAATGPGVLVRITDPKTQVSASVLLDALEELRNAGAEAVQLEGTASDGRVTAVRVVAQTALVDDRAGIVVDGVSLAAPYRFTVVGDPSTLAGAMAIPGGVEDAVRQQGGAAEVIRSQRVRVGALRPLTPPRYARPE
ncbi:MAG: hypothetical protein JWN87_2235 [Frankiales bacterium]|jgi:uncharacterized protein YlxW (UPF0749 family)|nr:hypothetical protein [Frankiales bacterium]